MSTENTENKNVEVKLSELKAMVEQGKKREDLMNHYGLNNAQVTKLMKSANLTFRKFHKPAFVLVDDINVSPVTNMDPNAQVPGMNQSFGTEDIPDWK